MPYYPEHTFVMGLTTIRRERRLPPGAIGSAVMVKEGLRVEAADTVLRGMVPGNYMILKALGPLGLRHADDLNEDVLQVQVGDRVAKGGIIAARGRGGGARTIKAPTDAVIARIEDGEIILQATPRPVEVQAMCPGEITSVRGTSEVLLETVGALIQCAWGNGKQVYSVYKAEAPEGIEAGHCAGHDAPDPVVSGL
jgi:hypothetical protein